MTGLKKILLLPGKVVSDQFIKNAAYPTCVSCKYYFGSSSKGKSAELLSKCTKFGEKNVITGNVVYASATLCRNDSNFCGVKGNYFTPLKI